MKAIIIMPNIYDFDKTVVYPDSGFTFFFFCLRRHFFRLLPRLPRVVLELLRFAIRRKRGLPPKGDFYLFFRGLPDWREEVRLFWETKADTMLKSWYLEQKRPDDIIISCTADLLLGPLCEQLGVRLIATRANPDTFLLEGYSCYGEEKVRRLREEFGAIDIGDFYSDSIADDPLAKLARRAWFVKGDEITPWPGHLKMTGHLNQKTEMNEIS